MSSQLNPKDNVLDSFVIKDYITTLKLFAVVCCCGWQRWKWIESFSSFDAMSSKNHPKNIIVSSS